MAVRSTSYVDKFLIKSDIFKLRKICYKCADCSLLGCDTVWSCSWI